MKKILAFVLLVFTIINLLIIFSGKMWLYHGIAITYLKGYTSSYINDFVYFPGNTINSGVHQKWLVSKRYNTIKTPKYLDTINQELESVSFIIIKNDSIQYEEYWHGYSPDTMSNSFSMSKSWVATLIGVAIKEKKINGLNQKICDFLPEFCVDSKSEITIKNLLTMSSGLLWEENYYNPIGKTADAYYGNNLRDLIINLKSSNSPGKKFQYNSACTQLLTFILESSTKQTISEYASEKLWKPLGAKHPALWSTDTEGGDEKGFCCINSNARDFARIGKLYLNYGNWNGVQILDSSYVKEATSVANLFDENDVKIKNYGYHFWITNYKNMHIYYARGLWGQYVICIPEKDMIIVRLGRRNGVRLEDGHDDDFYLFVDAALEMYP